MDLAAGHLGDPLVQQGRQGPHQPGLALTSLTEQDLLCRAFGRCRAGGHIDNEIGDLRNVAGPVEPRLFTYMRYNAELTEDGLEGLGLSDIDPAAVRSLDSIDHVDDLLRSRPDVAEATTTVAGDVIKEIAAVELGYEPVLPLTLSRDAVEDVFRTLATERRVDRARNPGLAAHMVPTVVGGCCVAVGIMRRLQLDEIEVVA